jgi:integrase
MVVLGRFAGLRAAEIAGASRMYLRRQDGDQVVHLLGKGDRWRTIPAHPDVVAVLSQASGHLFVNRHGLPITPNTVTRRMSRLLGEGWTAHSLRSGFASELYEETGDIALVSKLLGHADIETTKRYVLIRDVRAAEAVARLRLRAA